MSCKSILHFSVAGLTLIAVSLSGLAGAMAQDPKPIDFDRDIKPILVAHCNQCHMEGTDEEAEPYMDIKEEVMNYVEKGNTAKSPFYERLITDDESELMPPPENEVDAKPLTAEQIALIETWINQHAPWSGENPILPAGDDGKTTDKGGPDGGEEPAEENLWWELWEVSGVFHRAAVHFPIALLMISAFFALGGILRGSFVAADVSYYCLWMGMLSAIVAAALGWSFTMNRDMAQGWHEWSNAQPWGENWDKNKFLLHGWGGIGIALLSLIIAVYAKISRRSEDTKKGWMWCTLILAGVVGWVGHEGGKLDDKRLYDPAWEFVDKLRGKADDDDPVNTKKGTAEDEDSDKDKKDDQDKDPSTENKDKDKSDKQDDKSDDGGKSDDDKDNKSDDGN